MAWREEMSTTPYYTLAHQNNHKDDVKSLACAKGDGIAYNHFSV